MVFTAGWVLGGALQGGGYSPVRHYISDAAALTADQPWILLAAQGVAGVLTIAFALLALAPSLHVHGHGPPVSAWLVAASGLGLDNLSDAFFRLDCREVDAACLASTGEASWHAQIHNTVGTLTSAATLLGAFALARRFRITPAWRAATGPAIAFGVAIGLGMVANIVLDDAHGLAQRFGRLVAALGVALLAIRVATANPARAGFSDHR